MKITPLIDVLTALRNEHGELNVLVEDKSAKYGIRLIIDAIASSLIKGDHDFYILKVDSY